MKISERIQEVDHALAEVRYKFREAQLVMQLEELRANGVESHLRDFDADFNQRSYNQCLNGSIMGHGNALGMQNVKSPFNP